MSENQPIDEAFEKMVEQLPDIQERYQDYDAFSCEFVESYRQLLSHINQAKNQPELVGDLIKNALVGVMNQDKPTIAEYRMWHVLHPIWETDNVFGGARYERGLDYETYEIACAPLDYGYMERSKEAINPFHDVTLWYRAGANDVEIIVNDEMLPMTGNAPRHQSQHSVLAEVVTSLELAKITPVKQHDSTNWSQFATIYA